MKNNNYLEILNIVNNKGKVSVEEITDILNLSPSTVRREIRKLDEDGLVIRYHGGIKLSYNADTAMPYEKRVELHKNEKEMIAKKAVSFVEDNTVIWIDSGTTCRYIVDYINAKNLIVVTNGYDVVKPLLKKHYVVITPPGQVVEHISTYVDFVQDLDYLDQFTFDIAFIGSNSIHESNGFAVQNVSYCAILKKIISRSKKTYVLADHTKFGILNPYTFAKPDQCTIITNESLGDSFTEYDVIVAENE